MTILGLLVLSIDLPTLDTGTDIKMVYKLYRGAPYCANETDSECSKDPEAFCSKAGNNQTVCPFSSHPTMATGLLIPFLLNYFVCFLTLLRKEKNKKYTFIFALLNIYPQFGTYRQSFREIIGIIISIIQLPPGSSTSHTEFSVRQDEMMIFFILEFIHPITILSGLVSHF